MADDVTFQLYFRMARNFAFELPDELDRIKALKWIKKIDEVKDKTAMKTKMHAIMLLLHSLNRKQLVGVFEEAPSDTKGFLEYKWSIQPEQISKLIVQKEFKKFGMPPVSIDIAGDLCEMVTYQEIPCFGAHFYYAYSPEKIQLWDNIDKDIIPKGLLAITVVSRPNLSILHQSVTVKPKVKKSVTIVTEKTEREFIDVTVVDEHGKMKESFIHEQPPIAAVVDTEVLEIANKSGILSVQELLPEKDMAPQGEKIQAPHVEQVVAKSGPSQVVDVAKGKKMTKKERIRLEREANEVKLAEERLELDKKREEMLAKLPARLRQRLATKFVSKAQEEALKDVPAEFRAEGALKTPELFRKGYRKGDPICKKYRPEEFGLTKKEKFEDPYNIFANMEYEPPVEGVDYRRMPKRIEGPAFDIEKAMIELQAGMTRKEVEEAQDLAVGLSPPPSPGFDVYSPSKHMKPPTVDLTTPVFDLTTPKRRATPAEMTSRRKQLFSKLEALKHAEPKRLVFDEMDVQVEPEEKHFERFVFEDLPDEDRIAHLTLEEMNEDDIFGPDQISIPKAAPMEELDKAELLLQTELETSDIFKEEEILDPKLAFFEVIVDKERVIHPTDGSPIKEGAVRVGKRTIEIPGEKPISQTYIEEIGDANVYDEDLMATEEPDLSATPSVSQSIMEIFSEEKEERMMYKSPQEPTPRAYGNWANRLLQDIEAIEKGEEPVGVFGVDKELSLIEDFDIDYGWMGDFEAKTPSPLKREREEKQEKQAIYDQHKEYFYETKKQKIADAVMAKRQRDAELELPEEYVDLMTEARVDELPYERPHIMDWSMDDQVCAAPLVESPMLPPEDHICPVDLGALDAFEREMDDEACEAAHGSHGSLLDENEMLFDDFSGGEFEMPPCPRPPVMTTPCGPQMSTPVRQTPVRSAGPCGPPDISMQSYQSYLSAVGDMSLVSDQSLAEMSSVEYVGEYQDSDVQYMGSGYDSSCQLVDTSEADYPGMPASYTPQRPVCAPQAGTAELLQFRPPAAPCISPSELVSPSAGGGRPGLVCEPQRPQRRRQIIKPDTVCETPAGAVASRTRVTARNRESRLGGMKRKLGLDIPEPPPTPPPAARRAAVGRGIRGRGTATGRGRGAAPCSPKPGPSGVGGPKGKSLADLVKGVKPKEPPKKQGPPALAKKPPPPPKTVRLTRAQQALLDLRKKQEEDACKPPPGRGRGRGAAGRGAAGRGTAGRGVAGRGTAGRGAAGRGAAGRGRGAAKAPEADIIEDVELLDAVCEADDLDYSMMAPGELEEYQATVGKDIKLQGMLRLHEQLRKQKELHPYLYEDSEHSAELDDDLLGACAAVPQQDAYEYMDMDYIDVSMQPEGLPAPLIGSPICEAAFPIEDYERQLQEEYDLKSHRIMDENICDVSMDNIMDMCELPDMLDEEEFPSASWIQSPAAGPSGVCPQAAPLCPSSPVAGPSRVCPPSPVAGPSGVCPRSLQVCPPTPQVCPATPQVCPTPQQVCPSPKAKPPWQSPVAGPSGLHLGAKRQLFDQSAGDVSDFDLSDVSLEFADDSWPRIEDKFEKSRSERSLCSSKGDLQDVSIPWDEQPSYDSSVGEAYGPHFDSFEMLQARMPATPPGMRAVRETLAKAYPPPPPKPKTPPKPPTPICLPPTPKAPSPKKPPKKKAKSLADMVRGVKPKQPPKPPPGPPPLPVRKKAPPKKVPPKKAPSPPPRTPSPQLPPMTDDEYREYIRTRARDINVGGALTLLKQREGQKRWHGSAAQSPIAEESVCEADISLQAPPIQFDPQQIMEGIEAQLDEEDQMYHDYRTYGRTGHMLSANEMEFEDFEDYEEPQNIWGQEPCPAASQENICEQSFGGRDPSHYDIDPNISPQAPVCPAPYESPQVCPQAYEQPPVCQPTLYESVASMDDWGEVPEYGGPPPCSPEYADHSQGLLDLGRSLDDENLFAGALSSGPVCEDSFELMKARLPETPKDMREIRRQLFPPTPQPPTPVRMPTPKLPTPKPPTPQPSTSKTCPPKKKVKCLADMVKGVKPKQPPKPPPGPPPPPPRKQAAKKVPPKVAPPKAKTPPPVCPPSPPSPQLPPMSPEEWEQYRTGKARNVNVGGMMTLHRQMEGQKRWHGSAGLSPQMEEDDVCEMEQPVCPQGPEYDPNLDAFEEQWAAEHPLESEPCAPQDISARSFLDESAMFYDFDDAEDICPLDPREMPLMGDVEPCARPQTSPCPAESFEAPCPFSPIPASQKLPDEFLGDVSICDMDESESFHGPSIPSFRGTPPAFDGSFRGTPSPGRQSSMRGTPAVCPSPQMTPCAPALADLSRTPSPQKGPLGDGSMMDRSSFWTPEYPPIQTPYMSPKMLYEDTPRRLKMPETWRTPSPFMSLMEKHYPDDSVCTPAVMYDVPGDSPNIFEESSPSLGSPNIIDFLQFDDDIGAAPCELWKTPTPPPSQYGKRVAPGQTPTRAREFGGPRQIMMPSPSICETPMPPAFPRPPRPPTPRRVTPTLPTPPRFDPECERARFGQLLEDLPMDELDMFDAPELAAGEQFATKCPIWEPDEQEADEIQQFIAGRAPIEAPEGWESSYESEESDDGDYEPMYSPEFGEDDKNFGWLGGYDPFSQQCQAPKKTSKKPPPRPKKKKAADDKPKAIKKQAWHVTAEQRKANKEAREAAKKAAQAAAAKPPPKTPAPGPSRGTRPPPRAAPRAAQPSKTPAPGPSRAAAPTKTPAPGPSRAAAPPKAAPRAAPRQPQNRETMTKTPGKEVYTKRQTNVTNNPPMKTPAKPQSKAGTSTAAPKSCAPADKQTVTRKAVRGGVGATGESVVMKTSIQTQQNAAAGTSSAIKENLVTTQAPSTSVTRTETVATRQGQGVGEQPTERGDNYWQQKRGIKGGTWTSAMNELGVQQPEGYQPPPPARPQQCPLTSTRGPTKTPAACPRPRAAPPAGRQAAPRPAGRGRGRGAPCPR